MRSTTLPGGRPLFGHRPASRFGIDQTVERLLEVVLVAPGIEVGGQVVDQRDRHLELLRLDVTILGDFQVGRVAHLIDVEERLQREGAPVRPDQAHRLSLSRIVTLATAARPVCSSARRSRT